MMSFIVDREEARHQCHITARFTLCKIVESYLSNKYRKVSQPNETHESDLPALGCTLDAFRTGKLQGNNLRGVSTGDVTDVFTAMHSI